MEIGSLTKWLEPAVIRLIAATVAARMVQRSILSEAGLLNTKQSVIRYQIFVIFFIIIIIIFKNEECQKFYLFIFF